MEAIYVNNSGMYVDAPPDVLTRIGFTWSIQNNIVRYAGNTLLVFLSLLPLAETIGLMMATFLISLMYVNM